jgi:hypothetical protein
VIQRRWFTAVLLLAACGGGSGSGSAAVHPSNNAAAAVESFLQAVADSNLDRMAALWGTAQGPAATTHMPTDYERRIVVMQHYLRHETARIVSDTPETTENRHDIQVELRRQLCTWVVPFVAIRSTSGSWIVNQVDLTAAGNPARPCVPGQQPDTTAPPDSAAKP